jgi:uncharacterized membrane protein YhfC
MNIKLSNDSIVFHSLNDSTNWSLIVGEELEFLRLSNAINLSSEEIIVLSNLGCCGVYENGGFIVPRENCTETFSVPEVNTGLSWLGVLISFLPGLIIVIYLAKNNNAKYYAFLLGGIAWLLAFLIRIPLLNLIPDIGIVGLILIASLLAALFEEIIRYFLLKYFKNARENPIITGLGWGVTEAVIIYALNIAMLLLMNQAISFSDVVPGAVERLIITGFHTGLTLIVYKSLKDYKYLILSIFFHFFLNIVATITYSVFNFNVWIIELIILTITLITFYIAYKLYKGGGVAKKRKKSSGRTKKK